MTRAITTMDGDTADLIAWQVYGVTSGATEALLSANPGLAAYGPRLPSGLTVHLPDLPVEVTAPAITRLWD